MAKYSRVDEGLNLNQKKIEKISFVFALLCFILSFLLEKIFPYADIIITLILVSIFSIVCLRMRMAYIKNINRWFYARFNHIKLVYVFILSILVFYMLGICLGLFMLGETFTNFFGVNLDVTRAPGRMTHFIITDLFLGKLISKYLVFYLIIFLEEIFVIFLIFLRIVLFRQKAIDDIMNNAEFYQNKKS